MVFLITMLVILLIAAAVIIVYLVKINKEVKKIAYTTERSRRDISDFANLISAVRTPLLLLGTFTGIISKLSKNSKKKGKK